MHEVPGYVILDSLDRKSDSTKACLPSLVFTRVGVLASRRYQLLALVSMVVLVFAALFGFIELDSLYIAVRLYTTCTTGALIN